MLTQTKKSSSCGTDLIRKAELLQFLCFLTLCSIRYDLFMISFELYHVAAFVLTDVTKARHHTDSFLMVLLRTLFLIKQQICCFTIFIGEAIMLPSILTFNQFLGRHCCHWRLTLQKIIQLMLAIIHILLIMGGCTVSLTQFLQVCSQQVKRILQLIRSLHAYVLPSARLEYKIIEDSLAFGGRGVGITRTIISKNNNAIKAAFDSTLGYPGEGWRPLSLATWNTRSLTFERFQYCMSLNYDVLAITELWRNQSKFQNKSTRFTASSPILISKGARKGQMRYPKDRAAGVGIILSKRMQKKMMAFGSQGERVCWVRLAGPVCNLFIIAVYMPHRGRVQPCQDGNEDQNRCSG